MTNEQVQSYLTVDGAVDKIRQAIAQSPEAADQNMTEIIDSIFEPRERVTNSKTGLIQSIDIQGIRSFGSNASINLSKGLSIIYASNGTGKTSFVDALELLAEGTTSRSHAHPNAAAEVKDSDHIPHKNNEGKDLSDVYPPKVTVTWQQSETRPLTKTSWMATYGQPAEKAPNIQLIARRKLRQLVTAKPTQRLELLGNSLGLTETNEFWTAVSQGLRSPWYKTSPSSNVELLAEKRFEESKEIQGRDQLKQWLVEWATTEKSTVPAVPEQWVKPPRVPESQEWLALAKTYSDLEQNKPAPLTQQIQQLVDFYESLLTVSTADEVCPACEVSTITTARLDEVRSILDQNGEHKQYELDIIEANKKASRLCQSLLTAGIEWPKQPFETTASDNTVALRAATAEWRSLHNKLTSIRQEISEESSTTEFKTVGDLLTQLAKTKRHIDAELATHQKLEQSDREIAQIQDRWLEIELVETNTDLLVDQITELRRQAKLNELSETAAGAVRHKIRDYSAAVVGGLASNINNWLEILAPEGTPQISLEVKGTSGQPRLNINIGSSKAKTVHALGHLSDAQLDMLGMATHFARIERDHPAALVVIDDPSDMLDTETRKRFVNFGIEKMLSNDGISRQVVILTHDDQLVRDLWDTFHDYSPAISQDSIQLQVIGDADYPSSAFVPRDLQGALERAQVLLDGEFDNHRDRIWFRAALSAQTRVCLEMYAKQIAILLGPLGLQRIDSPYQTSDLGDVSTRIIKTLNDLMESVCNSNRHIQSRKVANQIRNLLATSSYGFLNPGAHADVTLPEITATKRLLTTLETESTNISTKYNSYRDTWVVDSPYTKALNNLAHCQGQCD